MENKLRIVTGVDDFKYLMLNTDVFVDKSLFIKDFLEGGPQTSLITRPRRWGKSLNMSMLEYFLKPELDSDGNLLPEEQRIHSFPYKSVV